jgi:nitrate reductase beta subunit
MRVMANVAMVMNLDKCIGCHTCTVTCKQVWTNRPGTEYVYFNNVETKPGIGYPKRYEDQTCPASTTTATRGPTTIKRSSRRRWAPPIPPPTPSRR